MSTTTRTHAITSTGYAAEALCVTKCRAHACFDQSPVALAMWNQAGAEGIVAGHAVRGSFTLIARTAILLVRTYAYYNRNKHVLALLCCMLSTVLAYQLWVDIKKMLRTYVVSCRGTNAHIFIALPFLNGVSGPCLPMAIPGQAHLLGANHP